MSEWLDAGDRAIWTGMELIDDARRDADHAAEGR